MRMRADYPRPLQVNGVVGRQARHGAMVGVSVLQTQLVPMAPRKGEVRRVGEYLIVVILRALHPVKQESAAPLPAPFVSHIRVKSERADVPVMLVTSQHRPTGHTGRIIGIQTAIRVLQITAVAVKHFCAPIESLELVVP